MDTIDSIKQEIQALDNRLKAYKDQKEKDRLAALTDHLKATAGKMAHDIAIAPYIAFKEAESYINRLQDAIEADGIFATDTLTTGIFIFKPNADGTVKTFDYAAPGTVVEADQQHYLVKSFDFSYGGSTAELLPLTTKAHILAAGEVATPYSATPVHFDRSTKRLTVSTRNKIRPGHFVSIDETEFEPTNVLDVQPGYIVYELEAIC